MSKIVEFKVDAEKLPKIAEMSETMTKIIADAKVMERKVKISKIKIDKTLHTMTVNYGGSTSKHTKETTFTGYDEMKEEKYFKLQSLKESVCEILGFPTDWLDDIVVTGISFNYDTDVDEMRGMVVTMQKEIEGLNCPLNINTPFIKFSRYIENNSPFPANESTWNYEVSNLVDEIIINAFLYMCGETKHIQQKLAV